MSIENLVGCRKALAGAFASAVMIAMSTSGAMAITGCAGPTGTSGFTTNPAQFNLQCMQPIILPTTLLPMQAFGDSEVVRTNGTTAFYYLADRSNRGIQVINAQSMSYVTIMKPITTGTPIAILNPIGGGKSSIIGYRGADPTGGFMGISLYVDGPATHGSAGAGPGTYAAQNTGPNAMAVYEKPGDPNSKRWLLVTDGGCLINNNGSGYSSPAAGGAMRSCSTPADPSVAGKLAVCASASCATQTLAGPQAPYGVTSGVTNYVSTVNPILNTANCTNPGPQYLTAAGLSTQVVCYPQNHQSNVKLFDLQKKTWVATFPTGGGCIDGGYPNSLGAGLFQIAMAPCTAPLGLYAPPSAAAPHGYSVTGMLGHVGSESVKIGVDSYDHQVYVLVVNGQENNFRMVGCQLSQTFNPPASCAESGGTLGPATSGNGGCSENAPAAGTTTTVKNTFIQPWDDSTPTAATNGIASPAVGIQGQTAGPYMTLFTMDPATGYLTYQATIKVDDHNSTNGPALPPGVAGPLVNGVLTSVLPNARQMVVESGFAGCDNKGRHSAGLFQTVWNPKAGAGGAFMTVMTNVLNNPPICYRASINNLCGPPTTNAGATITATTAQGSAPVPPGPGAFSQEFQGQSYIPGPWLGCVAGVGPGCDPSQGGSPAGGCIYPTGTASLNLVGSVNAQTNGGFEWDCDGAMAMVDPVYVYKGAKQPNILTGYPMYYYGATCPTAAPPLATTCDAPAAGTVPSGPGYYVPVGQPYDGVTDANNTFPYVLAACPNFKTSMNAAVLHNPLLNAPGGANTCPNGLQTVGPLYPGAVYPDNQKGIVFQKTTGSVGGVIYLPYCSPRSIQLGPTDIPGGWDGAGAGDVSTVTAASTGATDTFANIFLGCDPYYNGNTGGSGQGQLTTSIQENYSLALNTISAKPCAATASHNGGLGSGCGSAIQGGAINLNPRQSAFNDFVLPGPYPAIDPIPLFAHFNNNVNTPSPAGCIAQYPAVPPTNGGGTCGGPFPFIPPNAQSGALCSATTCPLVTGNQVMAGIISNPGIFNTSTNINAVTEAKFNFSNATRDPHWWVVVGNAAWTAAAMSGSGSPPGSGGAATRAPVLGYIDALTNQVIEYVPIPFATNTLALDEQNYVAFIPVTGVQTAQLPVADGSGISGRLCGNTTTTNGLTTGPGCIVVYRQQYLSPLGSSPHKGN